MTSLQGKTLFITGARRGIGREIAFKASSADRNPQILMLSPPLNMKPRWIKDHVAYTMSKSA